MKHYDSFSGAARELFDGCTPAVCPVSGGDINRAYRLTAAGKSVFMKANRKENAPFFDAEVSGLEAIERTGTIRVPEVLGLGTDERYGAFLLLEWAEGRPGKAFYEHFGHSLAAMHLADTTAFVHGGLFGFDADNYIGAGEQENIPESSWIAFFGQHRLLPQIKRAEEYFDENDRRRIAYLLDHLDRYLGEPKFPSLLHGDLWSGNYLAGNDGEACCKVSCFPASAVRGKWAEFKSESSALCARSEIGTRHIRSPALRSVNIVCRPLAHAAGGFSSLCSGKECIFMPTINMAATGRNINAIRRRAGMTVRDIQTAMGFNTPNAVYRWLRGDAMPTLDNLVILAAIFGVLMDDIIIVDRTDDSAISA